jgi:ribosomal protein L11 methyltransferase
MYMIRLSGHFEDWGEWPVDGVEERASESGIESWVYFSSLVVARSFAQAHGAKLERAQWEVNLDYQSEWRPMEVGTLFWLVPDSHPAPPPPGRIPLRMEPGLVFGAGDHPTTRGCLLMMEQTPLAGRDVFDLGCGTGILSEAALKLGARGVFGCDTDADAAALSHRRGVACIHGPSSAVRDARCDVLLVNIPGYVHLDLAPEYHRLLRPGGDLILSGYYDWQAGRIAQALPWFELKAQRPLEDGWIASIFSHARATASSA